MAASQVFLGGLDVRFLDLRLGRAAESLDLNFMVPGMNLFGSGRGSEEAGNLEITFLVGFLRKSEIPGMGIAFTVEGGLKILQR